MWCGLSVLLHLRPRASACAVNRYYVITYNRNRSSLEEKDGSAASRLVSDRWMCVSRHSEAPCTLSYSNKLYASHMILPNDARWAFSILTPRCYSISKNKMSVYLGASPFGIRETPCNNELECTVASPILRGICRTA